MNAKTFERALKSLDMTKQELADLFQLSLRTVQVYAQGGVTNTPTMILINLLLVGKITKHDVEVGKLNLGNKNYRAPVRGSYGLAD